MLNIVHQFDHVNLLVSIFVQMSEPLIELLFGYVVDPLIVFQVFLSEMFCLVFGQVTISTHIVSFPNRF